MNPIITTATTAAAIYVSTGLDVPEVEDARDWPEDREIDGTLCRRLSPEYFAWLRSHAHGPSRAQGRKSSPRMHRNTLRKRFNALQALAIREFGKELLQEGTALFSPEELSTTRASSRAPGETRRSSQKGLDLSREPSLEM